MNPGRDAYGPQSRVLLMRNQTVRKAHAELYVNKHPRNHTAWHLHWKLSRVSSCDLSSIHFKARGNLLRLKTLYRTSVTQTHRQNATITLSDMARVASSHREELFSGWSTLLPEHSFKWLLPLPDMVREEPTDSPIPRESTAQLWSDAPLCC